MDEKAIEISFNCDRDHIGEAHARTLIRNADRASALLRLAINAPRLDDAPITRVREQLSAGLAPRGQRSRFPRRPHMARAHLSRPPLWRFPSNGGTLGEPAGRRTRRPRFGLASRSSSPAAGFMLAIVGAIDAASAAKLIDLVFADLPMSSGASGQCRGCDVYGGLGTTEIVDLDLPQSTIRFGRPSLAARHDPDYMTSVLAHPYSGRRHRPFLASVSRGAGEARSCLFSVDFSLDARPCKLSPWRHLDQERAYQRIARRHHS